MQLYWMESAINVFIRWDVHVHQSSRGKQHLSYFNFVTAVIPHITNNLAAQEGSVLVHQETNPINRSPHIKTKIPFKFYSPGGHIYEITARK